MVWPLLLGPYDFACVARLGSVAGRRLAPCGLAPMACPHGLAPYGFAPFGLPAYGLDPYGLDPYEPLRFGPLLNSRGWDPLWIPMAWTPMDPNLLDFHLQFVLSEF